MERIILAVTLTLTALSAQAKEETIINMPFNECTSQAQDLTKKGINVKEINLIKSSGLIMWFFETKTHQFSVSCGLIGKDADYMSISKQTQAEYKAANKKAEAEQKTKVDVIANRIGL
jgi:hypothetical protein